MTEQNLASPDASVRGLLGDVNHIISSMDAAEWPSIATQVLEHHSPPIDDLLLRPQSRKLQQWLRALLEAMIDVDEDGVRAAAIKVRQYSD